MKKTSHKNLALKKYIRPMSMEEREAFAEKVGSSVGYFELLICGARQAGAELAKTLERESKGAIPKEASRPDLWGEPVNTQAA